MVPLVDSVSSWIDQRVVTTSLAAEETLTSDTVPVNVDAVLELSTIYAYVPLSLSVAGDRLVLHQNTGWLLQRTADRSRHALTWAARADVLVHPRVALVGEVYGAEGAAGADAEFQTGVRAFVRPDRVQLDLSYGGLLRTGRRGQGWTLGLTLSTPPFL